MLSICFCKYQLIRFFAIERGLIRAQAGETNVTIFQRNSEQIAVATVVTSTDGVQYHGDTAIDGVPGTAAPVLLEFRDVAGSTCGALLPTGAAVDSVSGIDVTMIDNGMPSVILSAEAFGITGTECPESLDTNETFRTRLEALRLLCGPLMNLGDVSNETVPKMVLVSKPLNGGAIHTRTFIPHKCHKAIGVLGAVSVATACVVKGSVAEKIASNLVGHSQTLSIEHPSGKLAVVTTLIDGEVRSAAVLRTASKLMDGVVFG